MDKNIYNKLTESAKSALEQSVQEFTEAILEKAYQSANFNNTADKEISLRDIIEAKEEILSPKQKEIKLEYRKRRISLMLSMTGVVYAVFGILYYIFQNNNYDITKDLGLIIAAIGIMLSIVAFFYTQLLTIRNRGLLINRTISERNNFEYEIVRKWQEIEKLGTELMLKEGISDNRAKSINFIVEFLSRELSNTISTNKFKKLLITRNELVHKGIVLSKNEIEEMLLIADEIISELERQIK